MSRMLLCETQTDLAQAMKDYFLQQDYTVEIETSGMRALENLRRNHYNIVISEMNLPGLDGLSLVRDYRARGGNTPILILSTKIDSDEMQRSLDAGADAYVEKPFQLDDLASQLRAMLRRPLMRQTKLLKSGALEMDTSAGTLTRNNKAIHLHPMEFKLLHFLLGHPNQVFDANALYERVWQKQSLQMDGTVRTHVRTIRRKIDLLGFPSIITTVRGLGYKAEQP